MSSDVDKLRDVLVKSYRNKAKDKIVKGAIKKRIADKKAAKKGKKHSKVRAHNLKQPLHTEASGALKAAKEKSQADDRVSDAKRKAETKPAKKQKKKNVFGLGQAISNIRKVKNDPRKTAY